MYIQEMGNLHYILYFEYPTATQFTEMYIRKNMLLLLLYFFSSCIQQQKLHINMIPCTFSKQKIYIIFLNFEWVYSKKTAHMCIQDCTPYTKK